MNLHSTRQRFALLGLSTVVFAILITIALTQRPPEEPQLNGKPLSHYLDLQTYGELRTERDARASITDFGSNAVPHLIRILEFRPTRIDSFLDDIAPRIPFVRFNRLPYGRRQQQAILACSALGPKAAAAVPALSNLVNDPMLGEEAISALVNLGADAFPVLTNALTAEDPLTRAAAAGALRSVAPPCDATPPLLQALKDPSSVVRANAASSLALVAPDHPETLPALIELLGHFHQQVRVPALDALGWMGTKAAPAEPHLRELLRTEEDTTLQQVIEQVLKAINPQQTSTP